MGGRKANKPTLRTLSEIGTFSVPDLTEEQRTIVYDCLKNEETRIANERRKLCDQFRIPMTEYTHLDRQLDILRGVATKESLGKMVGGLVTMFQHPDIDTEDGDPRQKHLDDETAAQIDEQNAIVEQQFAEPGRTIEAVLSIRPCAEVPSDTNADVLSVHIRDMSPYERRDVEHYIATLVLGAAIAKNPQGEAPITIPETPPALVLALMDASPLYAEQKQREHDTMLANQLSDDEVTRWRDAGPVGYSGVGSEDASGAIAGYVLRTTEQQALPEYARGDYYSTALHADEVVKLVERMVAYYNKSHNERSLMQIDSVAAAKELAAALIEDGVTGPAFTTWEQPLIDSDMYVTEVLESNGQRSEWALMIRGLLDDERFDTQLEAENRRTSLIGQTLERDEQAPTLEQIEEAARAAADKKNAKKKSSGKKKATQSAESA
jgi:hypothetical protein